MNKISLAKKLVLLFSVVFFASCDKEFNSIGSDIVGNDYFNFTRTEQEVMAYDSITGPVQSNNLPLNALGIYKNDPTFGLTTSHFVTQLELVTSNVTFNTNPVIDSVWVYVPYFSTQTGTDTDGLRTYELDSVYGDLTKKFKLKVYENGYYLGSYNPNNENNIQRHFSDEKAIVESNLRGADASGNSVPFGQYLNNGPVNENEQFVHSASERIIYKTDGAGQYVDASGEVLADQGDISARVIKERFPPGIWLNLNKAFFQKKILDALPEKLTNNNIFKEYFRGLYFQVEAINAGEGAVALLDFSKGYVKMTYKMDTATDDDNNPATPTATRLERSMSLKLAGNTVNFFDSNYTLPASDKLLYLKGGDGSVAYINMFVDENDADNDENGNDVPDQLDDLRDNNWMINEANLTFYIEKNIMDTKDAPIRIYLYDAIGKKPILDYYADGSTNSSKPKYNKKGFSGIIVEEDDKGVKYKIRITEYLKNCIKDEDAKNFKLGLVVTENINNITNAYLKPAVGQEPNVIVPLSSAINPLGTVLYGSNIQSTDADYAKRLKLEIYYTQPD
nr:DUF4270 domain-containing protein [uncultured Flavobacterium sp.]